MASCDYRSCDVCGHKAFYDAHLTYDEGSDAYGHVPYLIAGKPQFSDPEYVAKYGNRLGYVGDWAVICSDCAKTYRCVIEKKEQP